MANDDVLLALAEPGTMQFRPAMTGERAGGEAGTHRSTSIDDNQRRYETKMVQNETGAPPAERIC